MRWRCEHRLQQRAMIVERVTLDSVPTARCRLATLPSTDGRRRHAECVSDLRVREPNDIARLHRLRDNGPRLAQRHGSGVGHVRVARPSGAEWCREGFVSRGPHRRRRTTLLAVGIRRHVDAPEACPCVTSMRHAQRRSMSHVYTGPSHVHTVVPQKHVGEHNTLSVGAVCGRSTPPRSGHSPK
jgi:hypothetical protein